LYENVIGVTVELFQIQKVPGISEDIEIDNPVIPQPFTRNEITSDESCATSNEYCLIHVKLTAKSAETCKQGIPRPPNAHDRPFRGCLPGYASLVA